jgi:diaminopimelate epimerase
MKTNYTKMQSNGNDFLITEDSSLIKKTAELSDRIKNIGFDQLLYFQNGAMPELRVFNADGSEANNCVNGLRCVAFLYDLKNTYIQIKSKRFLVNKTSNGATVKGELPKVEKIRDYFVIKFGNNHIAKSCVNIDGFKLQEEYEKIKTSKPYNEIKDFNMSVFKICEDIIKIRTYENGTGETLSCGSATISVAYALSKELNSNELKISSRGGDTIVRILNDGVISDASAEIIREGFLNG